MKALKVLMIAIELGALAGCAAHPVRVSCGGHLTPINAQVPIASAARATKLSKVGGASDEPAKSELTRGH